MKNKYSEINGKYLKLVREIIQALKFEVENSKHYSKHITDIKAVKINLFGYEELINYGFNLTFLDSDGNHHALLSECTIEDLINILIANE